MFKKKAIISFLLIFLFFSSCSESSSDYSATVIVKGRTLKMTMYGGVYHDAIDDWEKVKYTLDKIVELHSVKKILIRVVDTDIEDDKYTANFVLIRVEKYFKAKAVTFDVRDERVKI